MTARRFRRFHARRSRAAGARIRVAALVVLLGVGLTACASGPFARRADTPAEALEHCIAETPAEEPLFADAFSACMERQGFVYASSPRPRAEGPR